MSEAAAIASPAESGFGSGFRVGRVFGRSVQVMMQDFRKFFLIATIIDLPILVLQLLTGSSYTPHSAGMTGNNTPPFPA
jgi:hypothetical protein